MRPAAYFVTLMVSVLAVVLSVALVVVATVNRGQQTRLELQRQTLNSGLLGPQGQQISASVLQDLAAAAEYNPRIRRLLEKQGYQLQGDAKGSVVAPAKGQPAKGEPDPAPVTEVPQS